MFDLLMRMLGRPRPMAGGAEAPGPAPLGRVAALPVFYVDAMNSPRLGSPSRSPGKAGRVMAAWASLGVPLDVREFPCPDPEDLHRIHDPWHVGEVLAGRRMNGFNRFSAEQSMADLWKCGAVVAACLHAARSRSVAVAPCTGFHHAHWRMSMDFCTFNGHLLAARRLLSEGLAARVAIVDLDRHFGDGTADILRRVAMPARGVAHYSFSEEAVGRLGVDSPGSARQWLDRLPRDLGRLFAEGCDFVIYNAGVDPHVDDPMGGYLTTEQLRERDGLVFAACRDAGVPVAWTLGGGYRRPYDLVLGAHGDTLTECWAALGGPA